MSINLKNSVTFIYIFGIVVLAFWALYPFEEQFNAMNSEQAIVPPEFATDPLDAYIDPIIWEKPVLINKNRAWPEYTRNF